MRELSEVLARLNSGLEGDLASRPERGVTLLSLRQWAEVQRELGAMLPWHTRRANLAIDGDGLGELIGQRLRIGEVVLRIEGETRPCELMDRLHAGLKQALAAACRGGVHGHVEQGGVIRIGDAAALVETA